MTRFRLRQRWLLAALGVLALGALAGCGGASDGDSPAANEKPQVVVTYSVLGSLVTDLVGDTADVTVLMPNGVDPHDWQPSAKDVEAINDADLVVANGLHLEEGLEETLDEAASAGVPVFLASDQVDVRTIGEGEVAEDDHEGEDEHAEDEEHAGETTEEHAGETTEEHTEGEEEHADEHGVGTEDPHIWTDPLAMEAVVAALATALETELGLDLAGRAADLEGRLEQLNTEIETTLGTVPADERKLVTGHESMGYFADRYGFTLVGALIPSISSQAEASAGELAELKQQIEDEGVSVIFTEIGTPAQVAEAIGEEAGAAVIELPSHNLPDDGSYFTFMRDIAAKISDALGS